MSIRTFPFYNQIDSTDCGATCLRMIARYYGKQYSIETLRDKAYTDKQGASMLGISDAAESIGLRTTAAMATYDALLEEAPFPCIIHWRGNHFVVLYRIDKKERAYIADPDHGLIRLDKIDFIKNWSGTIVDGEKEGAIMFFDPSPEFYQSEDAPETTRKRGLLEIIHYLKPYRRYLIQLFIVLLTTSLLQFAFPFLTQSVVDIGISTQNIGFINLVLIAQLMLFAGRTIGDFIRTWILLHMGSLINISMVSDFLAKLTRLPLYFFDGKMTGDLLQRVNDHEKVQSFFTTSITNILFSFFSLIVFSAILWWYNLTIFLTFLAGSILYVVWIFLFLQKRRRINYKRFEALATNQNNLIQIIQGMQEIKLNNAEKQNRWKWERTQVKVFKVNMKALSIDQYQQIGSGFINEVKNIIITFIAVKAVIDGSITLGMMLSIQYIIGQLNTPISEFVAFARSWQDALLSLERVGEIFSRKNEVQPENTIKELPVENSIQINQLSFQYGGPFTPKVLNDITFTIPKGKLTAIVGASGSGKTTLIKLLLKFYDPTAGSIQVGTHDLRHFNHNVWRSHCGTVMQDGYIFSDTIANNIAVGAEIIDKERLLYAVKIANIQEFIEELPLTYNTKIGDDGIGISGGQRQRILIARAVYKNPALILFDEATSSLDAANEKIIMQNLHQFFTGRTAIVVAHRLSTVKNADQIIVLNQGILVEQGTHQELVSKSGVYYHLVKNQLELGN
jgi:ATP-binding cassette subfamily B protein